MSQTINPGCWFEIAVSDLEAARKFYSNLLQVELSTDESGPNPMVMFPFDDNQPGVGGHLYPGKPAETGSTVHLVAPPDLDKARARIEAGGGSVESSDIPLPGGVGSFFYARDPDGNSIGLFNAA